MPSISTIGANLVRAISVPVATQIGYAIRGPSRQFLDFNSWSSSFVGGFIASSVIPPIGLTLQEPYQTDSFTPLLRDTAKTVMRQAAGAAIGSAILGICGVDGLTIRDAVSSSLVGSAFVFGAAEIPTLVAMRLG